MPAPDGWLQIIATTVHAALAEAVFEGFDAEAVTLLDAGTDPMVENMPNAHPHFERTRVVGLFTAATRAAPIEAALRDALEAGATLEHAHLADRHWAAAWRAEHPPLRFGERLWVAPHDATIDADTSARVVRLDPGLAFGTGTHATTALCLEWLSGARLEGRRVLDYGCGSGILAIAAARLGAASVTAVDSDDQALRATRDNAERNALGAAIETPPIEALAGPFDIVLANILAQPLIDLAPAFARLAAPDAWLLLSGLLERQAAGVEAAVAPAFVIEARAERDGWMRLDARRRRQSAPRHTRRKSALPARRMPL